MSCLGKEGKNPALSTTSGIIGALQAQEALKIIFEFGTIDGCHMQYDTLQHMISLIQLERNPSCPICGEEAFAMMEIEAMKSDEMAQLLEIRLGKKPLLMREKQLLINSETHAGETLLAIAGERKVKITVL